VLSHKTDICAVLHIFTLNISASPYRLHAYDRPHVRYRAKHIAFANMPATQSTSLRSFIHCAHHSAHVKLHCLLRHHLIKWLMGKISVEIFITSLILLALQQQYPPSRHQRSIPLLRTSCTNLASATTVYWLLGIASHCTAKPPPQHAHSVATHSWQFP
ncbi:hypothetical protein Tcan_00492, partial [Toxocara canis]